MRQRKIIHIDCDCFYAAIEMRDDPSLVGKPLAVGGSPDKRGVVATCNYEARAYGLHSAMAMRTAVKLCPDLTIVRPRMDVYRETSREIHAIFRDYTEQIEPLSLDEAYLDVSDSERCGGSATRIAQEIRRRVWETLHITVSAGVAPNKFIAKIASDWRKPNGLFVVTPDEVDGFVAELPVKKLHGVGKVTAEKLARLGIRTCSILRDGARICAIGRESSWQRSSAVSASACGGCRGGSMSVRYRWTAGASRSAWRTLSIRTCLTLPPARRNCRHSWARWKGAWPTWTPAP